MNENNNSKASGNPYVGPQPFSRDKARFFFGRDLEARQLLSLVVAERVVLFSAQSGTGKSSLINTRLIPELEDKGFQVLPVARVSSASLARGRVENIYAYNVMLSLLTPDQATRMNEALRDLQLSEFLGQLLNGFKSVDPSPEAQVQSSKQTVGMMEPRSRRALIIDQFEEIFTAYPDAWEQRQGFFQQLATAIRDDSDLWVVLTLREDYEAALSPYKHIIPGGLRSRYYMQRMDSRAALLAVKEPASAAGLPFSPTVAEELVENLRLITLGQGQDRKTAPGEFIEPVQLQVVCFQLWENLASRPGGIKAATQITRADLLGLIGTPEKGEEASLVQLVNQALAKFYEQALSKVVQVPNIGISESDLREWFEKELITEAGTRGLVYYGETETAGLSNNAVDLLAGQYIIRKEPRAGGTWVELVHDRLVEPIRKNNADWFEKLNDLQRWAILWDRGGRPGSLLLRNEDLDAAEEWAKKAPFLSEREKALLEASCELRESELEKQELVIKERTAARQRRLLVLTTVMALVAVGLFIITLVSRQNVQNAKETAEVQLALLLSADSTQTALVYQNELAGATGTVLANQQQEAKATSQAVSNQSTLAASLRDDYGTATSQVAQENQIAQVATQIAQQIRATPETSVTPSAGETPGVLIPVTGGGGGVSPGQLISAANSLKLTQPDLALLLGATAVELSGQDAEISAQLSQLIAELSQTWRPLGNPAANMGSPATSVGYSSTGNAIVSSDSAGDVSIFNPTDYSPYASIKGLPAGGNNYLLDPSGRFVTLVGPPAVGLSITSAEVDAPNWNDVATAGIRFALLRASETMLEQRNARGSTNKFQLNWQGMIGDERFTDLIRGVYWEFDPGVDPVKQADAFYALVTDAKFAGKKYGEPGDLPLVLQVMKAGGLGQDDLARSVKATLDQLEKDSGRKPIIYTAPDFWNQYMVDARGKAPEWTSDYPLWVRDPASQGKPQLPSGWSVWFFWDVHSVPQLGETDSSLISISGVSSYYQSQFNGTLFQLEQFAGKDTTKEALKDNRAYLWDILGGKSLRELKVDPDQMSTFSGSPNGEALYTGHTSGNIFYWNLVSVLRPGTTESSTAPTNSFSNIGQPVKLLKAEGSSTWLISADENHSSKLWLINAEIYNYIDLRCPGGTIVSPNYAANSSWLASGSPKGACLWALRPAGQRSTGQLLPGTGYEITFTSFSPDSTWLAGVGVDRVVYIWDVSDPAKEPVKLAFDVDMGTTLAFSPDGQSLAAGSEDGDIWYWKNWKESIFAGSFHGHSGRINQIAFSPDGKWMISAGEDGQLIVWDLSLDSPIKQACALANRNPTERELASFGLDEAQVSEFVTLCRP